MTSLTISSQISSPSSYPGPGRGSDVPQPGHLLQLFQEDLPQGPLTVGRAWDTSSTSSAGSSPAAELLILSLRERPASAEDSQPQPAARIHHPPEFIPRMSELQLEAGRDGSDVRTSLNYNSPAKSQFWSSFTASFLVNMFQIFGEKAECRVLLWMIR